MSVNKKRKQREVSKNNTNKEFLNINIYLVEFPVDSLSTESRIEEGIIKLYSAESIDDLLTSIAKDTAILALHFWFTDGLVERHPEIFADRRGRGILSFEENKALWERISPDERVERLYEGLIDNDFLVKPMSITIAK